MRWTRKSMDETRRAGTHQPADRQMSRRTDRRPTDRRSAAVKADSRLNAELVELIGVSDDEWSVGGAAQRSSNNNVVDGGRWKKWAPHRKIGSFKCPERQCVDKWAVDAAAANAMLIASAQTNEAIKVNLQRINWGAIDSWRWWAHASGVRGLWVRQTSQQMVHVSLK